MSNKNMGRKPKAAARKRTSKIDVSTQTQKVSVLVPSDTPQPVVCLKRLEVNQTVTELDETENQNFLKTYRNFEQRLSKNRGAHSTMTGPKRRSVGRPGPLCSKNRKTNVITDDDLDVPIVLDNSSNISSAFSPQNLEPIPEAYTPENLDLDNSHLPTNDFVRGVDINDSILLSLDNVEALVAQDRTNKQTVTFEVTSPHSIDEEEKDGEIRENLDASSNENKSENVSYEFIKVQSNVVYIHNHFYRK